jgi:hypothetical protein
MNYTKAKEGHPSTRFPSTSTEPVLSEAEGLGINSAEGQGRLRTGKEFIGWKEN